MGALYRAHNGPQVTTAAFVNVASGTAIKTMLQLQANSNGPALKVVEWGWSCDASALAAPGQIELIETGAVAATVTAYAAGDIAPYNDPNAPTSTVTLGTTASGYTASAEGTITATRLLDGIDLDPVNYYFKQFPLGREPMVKAGNFLRIRNTLAATVNVHCYVVWEE